VRKRVLGAATTICVMLGLPAAAGAVATWSVASPLSEGASLVDTAMGPNGDAATTWVGFVAGKPAVQVATRPPAGNFSAPLDLSPAGNELTNAAQVAEDAAGEATVVWNSSVEKTDYVVEADTVANGIPSAPAKLSEPGQSATFPTVAVDERGDAIVAWTRFDGADEIVQATFRPAGGSFEPTASVSAAGGSAATPRVAIDAAGDATVVWERNNGVNEIVEEATRPAATGKFAPAVALSNPAEGAIQPSVAVNAEGDTAVAWVRVGASNVTQATVRPAGGKFSEPANLSGNGFNADHPQVALDGRGDPTVVWARTLGFEIVVEYANGTPVGAFSPPEGLAFEAWYPSIAEDAAGDTLVGYATVRTPTAGAVFRPAGGAFGAGQQISPAGQIVDGGPGGFNVAMSGDGDGVYGFIAEEPGVGFTPRVSLLDAVGVALEKASIPATATAGVPVTFSVEPRDVVFAQPTVSWAFGDASTASGDSVTHTFANPGTYSVTVTAIAAPGDSATQTASIVVAPPAPSVPAFHAATFGSTTVAADSHGRVHLKLACPAGGAACAGAVTLTLPATASGLAMAAHASGTPVTVAAGHASFSAAAGASTTVGIALPSAVLQLLKRHHRLTLTATVESHGTSDQSAAESGKVVVKAYVKPKRSKAKKKKK
jgi:PKD domain